MKHILIDLKDSFHYSFTVNIELQLAFYVRFPCKSASGAPSTDMSKERVPLDCKLKCLNKKKCAKCSTDFNKHD